METIEHGAIEPVPGLPFIGRRPNPHDDDGDMVLSIHWSEAGVPPNPSPAALDGTSLGLSDTCELVAVGRQDDPDLHRTLFWLEIRDLAPADAPLYEE